MRIEKAVAKLEECAYLEGSEIGETWEALLALWSRQDYISNKKLVKQLRDHIISEAKEIEKNWEITESEETTTRTIKTLEYIGD